MKRFIVWDDGPYEKDPWRTWGPAIIVILFVAIVVGLILAGKAIAEVSPEKQAQLEQHGWVIHNESETLVNEAGPDCRHGATKRIASSIEGWNGPLVRARNKLSVCVWNGQIVWRRSDYSHAAPGRHWSRNWGPHLDSWLSGSRGSAGIRSRIEWAFDGVVTQFWTLSLKLTAHVRGDHGIYFTAKRRWF